MLTGSNLARYRRAGLRPALAMPPRRLRAQRNCTAAQWPQDEPPGQPRARIALNQTPDWPGSVEGPRSDSEGIFSSCWRRQGGTICGITGRLHPRHGRKVVRRTIGGLL
jgi:hypothetical protein